MSSQEQRLQIKRAILSELNKELSKKIALQPKDLLKTVPVKLHKPSKSVSRNYDAQAFEFSKPKGSIAVGSNADTCLTTAKSSESSADVSRSNVRNCVKIWKNETFGDMLNQKRCTTFYRTRTLRTVFSTWKEATYVKQTEWKHVVRAECHYKFSLREKCWDRWKLFMTFNKENSRKKELAHDKMKEILLKKYFSALKAAVGQGKEKQANMSLAFSVYERNLYKRILNQWKSSLNQLHKANEDEYKALKFWALALQRQCLAEWVNYKNERTIKQQLNDVIDQMYRSKLLKRSYTTWIAYHNKQKVKKILLRRANKLLSTKLVHKYFYQWESALAIHHKAITLKNKMSVSSRQFKLRAAFSRWKRHTSTVKRKKQMKFNASKHYSSSLILKCFKALLRYKNNQLHSALLVNQASTFRRRKILQQHFVHWIKRFDDAEEKKIKFRSLMARRFHQQRVLRLCLSTWFDYKEFKKNRKELFRVAVDHHNETLSQKAFSLWHVYVCYRNTAKVKQRSALVFRTDLLYHKYFYTWVKMNYERRNLKANEMRATEFYSYNILKQHYQLWKTKRKESQEIKAKIRVAESVYNIRLTKLAFRSFSDYCQRAKVKNANNKKALQFCNMRQVSRHMKCWDSYVKKRRLVNRNKAMACNHYNNKIVTCSMKLWLEHHSKLKAAKQTLCRIQNSVNLDILKSSFVQWKYEVTFRRTSHVYNIRSDKHYKTGIKAKVLQHWLRYTEQKARQHVFDAVRLHDAELRLNNLRRKQVLRKWHQRCVSAKQSRLKEETADEHYYKRLYLRCINAFRASTAIAFKKKLLAKTCEVYQMQNCVSSYFNKWKYRVAEKQETDFKSKEALLFW